MSKISATLNTLSTARQHVSDTEAAIEDYIPEFLLKQLSEAKARVKELEATVKQQAKSVSGSGLHTLQGDSLQLVFKPHGKGGKWLDYKLEALCRRHEIPSEELDACRSPWEATWSICKR